MLSASEARQVTLRRLGDAGFPQPPAHLPLLADHEFPFVLRSMDEVIDRILVVAVRLAIAFGMPISDARLWLSANSLTGSLSSRESALVGGLVEGSAQDTAQVEALWALAWAVGLVPRLDHAAYCSDELVTLLPDLRIQEPVRTWRARTHLSLRSPDELLAELDLLYAMTWGIASANLAGSRAPGEVEEYVFWERRRALEWVRIDSGNSHSGWDEIDLST